MRMYANVVQGAVLSVVLIGLFFCTANAAAAAIDLIFGLRWGYTWAVIPASLAMGVGFAGFGMIIRAMSNAFR
jgi:hypothetical protein